MSGAGRSCGEKILRVNSVKCFLNMNVLKAIKSGHQHAHACVLKMEVFYECIFWDSAQSPPFYLLITSRSSKDPRVIRRWTLLLNYVTT